MDRIPTLGELMRIAPVVTITIVIMAIGWWARGKIVEEHITSLKEFIEFLKNSNK